MNTSTIPGPITRMQRRIAVLCRGVQRGHQNGQAERVEVLRLLLEDRREELSVLWAEHLGEA